jgi:HEAT repeat protein
MRRHSWLVLMIVPLVLLASSRDGETAPAEDEPVYQGRTLTEWIDDLKSTDENTQCKAARTLPVFGPKKKVVRALTSVLKTADPDVIGPVADSLRIMGVTDKEVIEALAAVMENNDTEICDFRDVSKALGKIGAKAKAVVPRLLPLLNESDAYEGDPASYKRALTCHVLGSIGLTNKKSISMLEKIAQHDPKEFVRLSAYAALAKIDASRIKGVLPRLTAGLQSKDSDVVEFAAFGLVLLGPGARAALPSLRTLHDQTSDPALKKDIGEVIKAIQHSKNAFDW